MSNLVEIHKYGGVVEEVFFDGVSIWKYMTAVYVHAEKFGNGWAIGSVLEEEFILLTSQQCGLNGNIIAPFGLASVQPVDEYRIFTHKEQRIRVPGAIECSSIMH